MDVASQGKTKQKALDNLREALELYFSPPFPVPIPKVDQIDVEIPAEVTIATS